MGAAAVAQAEAMVAWEEKEEEVAPVAPTQG